jgi:microcystin-dependent protein
MADPFVAEIRIFPFTFAPRGWAFCDGQLMPISQNTALFSLLGTIYGGDGKATFAIPNLKGSAAMHPNYDNPHLARHDQGEVGGSDTVTLLESEIPAHAHALRGSDAPADTPAPAGSTPARSRDGYQQNTSGNLVAMAPEALPPAGGGQPHNNMQPYLTLHFNIALQGVFPQRP